MAPVRGSRGAGARIRRLLAAATLLSLSVGVRSADSPRIALIMDDVGNGLAQGRATLALPGALTVAILPHTPHARRLAQEAFRAGKEVMLHLPMQAMDGTPLGPGALTLHMSRATFLETLDRGLASVPHVAGVNNHMGSLLTRHPGAMQWMMRELQKKRLFFVDSRTTPETVAERIAAENAVAVARRDVFLDDDPSREAVRRQFHRLLAVARRRGTAIGIAHPHPATLSVLAEELPRLRNRGIEMVPASLLTNTYLRRPIWHASSSRSPKVAKSSKRSPSSTCCAELK